MILLLLIILPILAGLIAYITPKVTGKNSTILIQLSSLGLGIYNFRKVISDGPSEIVVGNYEKVAGIVLRADIFSSTMILLTTSLFLLTIIYIRNNSRLDSHFFFLYLVLESCMIAMFVTRDIFNIFVIVEVCTIIIAILIMYKNEKSLYDSLIYLMNNTVAMVFFVFGIAILYKNLSTLNIDLLTERMHGATMSGSYIAAYAMLLTGVSFKCALMPMFSWLPRAHAAKGVPTVVSAVLSSLYIKTGLFVFIRIRGIFLPLLNIDNYLITITILTSLIGAILAFRSRNIKLILAYSTISQIGLIMTGVLSGNYISENGAVFHLVNHVIFKSTLFLTAGIFIKHYGHKDITKMRGAMKSMPVASIACLFALLGVTGAPFWGGSISKYYIEYGFKGGYISYIIPIINTGTIVYFFKFFQVMFGEKTESVHAEEVKCIYKNIVVLTLGSLCLLGGVFYRGLMSNLLDFEVPLDTRIYAVKGIIYFLTLGICYLLSHYKITIKTPIKKINLSPSFNGISIMTCGFFTVTTVAIYLSVL